jgi:hypothetical protein
MLGDLESTIKRLFPTSSRRIGALEQVADGQSLMNVANLLLLKPLIVEYRSQLEPPNVKARQLSN